MKKIWYLILCFLSLATFPFSAYATCDVTGATVENGEVVVCTGIETNGYLGTDERDTVDVQLGATVGLPSDKIIDMLLGNDEVTINGGTVTGLNDCVDGGEGDDVLVINSGICTSTDGDGLRGAEDADRIEMHGGTMTVADDGLEGDDGNDVIIMTGGTLVVTGTEENNYGIGADQGEDTITVSGGSITVPVTSGAAIWAGDDDDQVELAGPVRLVGIVDGGDGTDTLRFSMRIPIAQVDAVNSALVAAAPASGSITINGLDYTWTNFESIEAAVGASPPASIPASPFWSLVVLSGLLGLSGLRRLGSRIPRKS